MATCIPASGGHARTDIGNTSSLYSRQAGLHGHLVDSSGFTGTLGISR